MYFLDERTTTPNYNQKSYSDAGNQSIKGQGRQLDYLIEIVEFLRLTGQNICRGHGGSLD